MTTTTADAPGRRPRPLRRALVWTGAVWVAAVVAIVVWAAVTSVDPEDEAPELVAAVDDAMRGAAAVDPTLAERLVAAERDPPPGSPRSVVPEVAGAEAIALSVAPDGSVVVGYRGVSLAGGVCVRSVLSPAGAVTTEQWSCDDL